MPEHHASVFALLSEKSRMRLPRPRRVLAGSD